MNLKQFFRFTRGERRGIYCLGLIAAILFCAKIAISYHKNEMERLRSRLINTDSITATITKHKKDFAQIQTGNKQSDKNTVTANSDISCRNNKKATIKKDCKHVVVISDSLKNEIRNWKNHVECLKNHNATQKSENYNRLMIELNTADTSDLKKLWGIGNILSQRIIRFRDKLGGFYSTMQLAEVYGISAETLEKILPHVTTDTMCLKKVKVNSAPIYEMKKHPYISYYMAVAIDSIRLSSPDNRIVGFSVLAEHPDFHKSHKLLRKYLAFE